MVGREAYHNPWWLAEWDSRFFGEAAQPWRTREWVEERMTEYMAREAAAHGTPWSSIARHMLGLRHGMPGARRWRQVWSDHRLKESDAARGDGAGARDARRPRPELRDFHGPAIRRNALNLNNLGLEQS